MTTSQTTGRLGRAVLGLLAAAAAVVAGGGQPPAGGRAPAAVPPEGLRENTPAVHALVNARIVIDPKHTIERGTVVFRDGVIVAVGPAGEVKPPADARVWDLTGRTIYPGLIDAYGELADSQRS